MTPLRLLLNSSFSGANAFLAIALRQGLFRRAGLDVACTPGRGAYTAAQRLMDEGFDAAYGDVHALVELVATRPLGALPLAVLMVHQSAPSTITVARDGPIRCAADLSGRSIVGHASDVALRTFPVFARQAGLAPTAVAVRTAEAGMATLLGDLLAGHSDAVFGYVTTHTAVLAGTAVDAAAAVRFLPYRDVCPDLYGSALMVAPHLVREQPQVVAALVQVVMQGIAQAQAHPAEAIDAVLALQPDADRTIERARWHGTSHADMAAASGAPCRTGDVDDARLARGITSMAQALQWPDTPDVRRVFTRAYLPGPAAA
jgi:NitT/TauT family transport system substrate-binding protein